MEEKRRMEKENRRLALYMGEHPRLGAASGLRLLGKDVLSLVEELMPLSLPETFRELLRLFHEAEDRGLIELVSDQRNELPWHLTAYSGDCQISVFSEGPVLTVQDGCAWPVIFSFAESVDAPRTVEWYKPIPTEPPPTAKRLKALVARCVRFFQNPVSALDVFLELRKHALLAPRQPGIWEVVTNICTKDENGVDLLELNLYGSGLPPFAPHPRGILMKSCNRGHESGLTISFSDDLPGGMRFYRYASHEYVDEVKARITSMLAPERSQRLLQEPSFFDQSE